MGKIFSVARGFVFGGCRHKNMGWPICLDGYTYRVCLDCGIKRLFDEDKMRGYGPYGYEVHELLAGASTAKPVIAPLAGNVSPLLKNS